MLRLSLPILFIVLCTTALAQDFRVQRLSVSSGANNEMAPVVRDSVLYFSTNKPSAVLKKYFDQNKEPLYHMYASVIHSDSSLSKPKRFLPDELCIFNTASISFSKDGKSMYVSQNHYDSYKRSQRSRTGNQFGVYVYENGDRGWSRPSGMPFNSRRDYNVAQASLSTDENTMFFISDADNGYGKTDIFYSEKINGEWGPAVNLGSRVNTAQSEVFPFYHPSGKLIFASNGHGGKGGLDLFYTVLTDNGWTAPQPYIDILNTPDNDYACYVSDDEQWGVFTSDRDGTDNLYRFDRQYPTFDVCAPQIEPTFCYEFFDDVEELDNGPYIYQWTIDKKVLKGAVVKYCFPSPGEYNVKLSMVDTLINQEIFALSEYAVDIQRPESLYISSSVNAFTVNAIADFTVATSNFGDFSPKEFYWNMGDGTLLKGETIQHVFRKRGKYTVQCGAVSTKHPQLKMCSTIIIEVTD